MPKESKMKGTIREIDHPCICELNHCDGVLNSYWNTLLGQQLS